MPTIQHLCLCIWILVDLTSYSYVLGCLRDYLLSNHLIWIFSCVESALCLPLPFIYHFILWSRTLTFWIACNLFKALSSCTVLCSGDLLMLTLNSVFELLLLLHFLLFIRQYRMLTLLLTLLLYYLFWANCLCWTHDCSDKIVLRICSLHLACFGILFVGRHIHWVLYCPRLPLVFWLL